MNKVEQEVRTMDFNALFELYNEHAGKHRLIKRDGNGQLDRITVKREVDGTKMYTTEESIRAAVVACKLHCTKGQHSF